MRRHASQRGRRVDEKDFKQAMKWYRRAPVTHVAPDAGSLVSPQKKDVTQREKARVWFPRPVACSMGMTPDSPSEDATNPDSAYGALAVYREKQVMVHGPAEKVDPESLNAPEVPLADTMTEDNPPYDVDYTVVSDEAEPLQLGISAGEQAAGNAEAGDPFAGVMASVETGIAGMLAEKPSASDMLAAGDGDDDDAGDDDDVAAALAGLSEEERAEIAGFDLSLLKADEAPAAAKDVLGALSEEELAEIAGFDPTLLLDGGEEAASSGDGGAPPARHGDPEAGRNVPGEAPVAETVDMAGVAQEAPLAQADAFAAAESALMEALIADEAAARSALTDGAEASVPESDVAGDTGPEGQWDEAVAEAESHPDATDGMVRVDDSGFDAPVAETGQVGHEAGVPEAVLDPELEVLTGPEAAMTAREVDLEEALSAVAAVEAADSDTSPKEAIPHEGMPDAAEAQPLASGAVAETSPDEMIAGEAPGSDALVAETGEAVDEAAVLEAVLDPESEVLSEAEEELTAREVDLEEAISTVEATAAADFDPAMAEAILAEVMPEEAAEQPVTETEAGTAVASDEMFVGEATGFDALVEEAEDEARDAAVLEAVLDPEPEVLSEAEEALTALEVDLEEAISTVEATAAADFDPAMAEDILAEVMPEGAEEQPVSGEAVKAATTGDKAGELPDGMTAGEASGFDALVQAAEDESQQGIWPEPVQDVPGEEENLTREVDPRPAALPEMADGEEETGSGEMDFVAALTEDRREGNLPEIGAEHPAAQDEMAEDGAGADAIGAVEVAMAGQEAGPEEALPSVDAADAAESVAQDTAATWHTADVSGEMQGVEVSGLDALPEEAADQAREEATSDLETEALSDAQEGLNDGAVDAGEGLAVEAAAAEDTPQPTGAMMIDEASGLDALVQEAEDQAAEDAGPESVRDPEAEGLTAKEGMTAQAVDAGEALSTAAAADAAGFDPALAEDILADVMPETAQDEPTAEAEAGQVTTTASAGASLSDEMVIGEASGFDALVQEAEDQALQEALLDAAPDPEPEGVTAQEGMTAQAVDVGEALPSVETANAAGFDAALAEDVPAEAVPPAGEAQPAAEEALAAQALAHPEVLASDEEEASDSTLAEMPADQALTEPFDAADALIPAQGQDPVRADGAAAATGGEAAAGADNTVMAQAPAEVTGAQNLSAAEAPDPETALADGILMVEGETPPDFEVPRVPILDEMTTGPEVAIPEEQVFRDKIEAHQRNKMAFAEYKVAAAYAREDTPASRLEALKWYTRAAENGHAVSQFNLGNIYYAGRGVAQDYTLAADWYELAAAQGVARAQDNLGLMYFHGRGRPVEPEMAVYWFRQAAIQGYVPAQYKLAMHLEAGVGTEPDPEEALHWYKKAASQGDAKAKKDVARLTGKKEA